MAVEKADLNTSVPSPGCYVNFVQARGLARNGKCDPYGSITLGQHYVHSTTIYNCLSPVWDDEFSFPLKNPSNNLIIDIFDEDLVSDVFIGECVIDLRDYEPHKLYEEWFELKPQPRIKKNAIVRGEVLVKFLYKWDEVHHEEKPEPEESQKITLPDRLIPLYKELLQATLDPGLQIPVLLMDSCTGAVASNQIDKLLHSIVVCFHSEDRENLLLEHCIQEEVCRTSSAPDLFRSNTVTSKILKFYAQIVGDEFLLELLAPLVQKVVDKDQTIELDPARLCDQTNLNDYVIRLEGWCQEFFNAIIRNLDRTPRKLRETANMLKQVVGAKFPYRNSIASFYFLRFMCPAIVSPYHYKVVDQHPKKSNSRCLILIAKTLQLLANGTSPGGKEAYMALMDDWISANSQHLENFLNDFTEYENVDPSSDGKDDENKDKAVSPSANRAAIPIPTLMNPIGFPPRASVSTPPEFNAPNPPNSRSSWATQPQSQTSTQRLSQQFGTVTGYNMPKHPRTQILSNRPRPPPPPRQGSKSPILTSRKSPLPGNVPHTSNSNHHLSPPNSPPNSQPSSPPDSPHGSPQSSPKILPRFRPPMIATKPATTKQLPSPPHSNSNSAANSPQPSPTRNSRNGDNMGDNSNSSGPTKENKPNGSNEHSDTNHYHYDGSAFPPLDLGKDLTLQQATALSFMHKYMYTYRQSLFPDQSLGQIDDEDPQIELLKKLVDQLGTPPNQDSSPVGKTPMKPPITSQPSLDAPSHDGNIGRRKSGFLTKLRKRWDSATSVSAPLYADNVGANERSPTHSPEHKTQQTSPTGTNGNVDLDRLDDPDGHMDIDIRADVMTPQEISDPEMEKRAIMSPSAAMLSPVVETFRTEGELSVAQKFLELETRNKALIEEIRQLRLENDHLRSQQEATQTELDQIVGNCGDEIRRLHLKLNNCDVKHCI